MFAFVALTLSVGLSIPAAGQSVSLTGNSTYYNPILPGFHPDPSCIFVPDWDNTYFCASSSFNAFPGIPIHASKDLQNWKLIGKAQSRIFTAPYTDFLTQVAGHALNRREQLPRLAETNRSTRRVRPRRRVVRYSMANGNSGIWAPSLRYNNKTFWLVTTLVDDDKPQADASRWDNVSPQGE